MDIGFFHGPANLMEVYERKADPAPEIIKGRQGFMCYLLIVDRSTWYMWVFPMRSKSVSPDLIQKFLQTHGNRQASDSEDHPHGRRRVLSGIHPILTHPRYARLYTPENGYRHFIPKRTRGTPTLYTW